MGFLLYWCLNDDDDEGKILQLPVRKKSENVNCTSFCNNVFWWSEKNEYQFMYVYKHFLLDELHI